MRIIEATEQHLYTVAKLFDLYRIFYGQKSDISAATSFLKHRMDNKESVVLFSLDDAGRGLGFAQIYPSFCSVDLVKIYILYDLYVIKEARRMGVGQRLLDKVTEYAEQNGIKRIDLLTGLTNNAAQNLYRQQGFKESNHEFLAMSKEVE